LRDPDGGAGARGRPAGGSVQAPLRHRPHAPVSPGSGFLWGVGGTEEPRSIRLGSRGGWTCLGVRRPAEGWQSAAGRFLTVGGGAISLCRELVILFSWLVLGASK